MAKLITKERAVRAIVTCMCRYGHMNGWFGDVGKEFRQEQVDMFMGLSRSEQLAWLERNGPNIRRHCRVPERIMMIARWNPIAREQTKSEIVIAVCTAKAIPCTDVPLRRYVPDADEAELLAIERDLE